MYVKKINYFVSIIHQVNKHGISRRWFTEADVKDFKSGVLRPTTKLIAKYNLFFQYCDSKKILFYYFCDTKLCAKHTKSM